MALALIKEKAEDVFAALKMRYTCREFRPDPLPCQTIETILESANRAPSAANTQPWEIYVATGEPLDRLKKRFFEKHDKYIAPDPDYPLNYDWPPELEKRRREMMDLRIKREGIHPTDTTDARQPMAHDSRFFNAPAVVYLCMENVLGCWSIFDLGIFSQSLMLAAKAMGVDTAPALMLVGYPDLIREELDIPEHLAVVFGIAIGYGTDKSRPAEFASPRRLVDQFVKWKGF